MKPGYLTYTLRETGHSVEASHSYPADYPLYDLDRSNDVYRVGASVYSDRVSVFMQHLRLSDPPWTGAEAPGRIVSMTYVEFSQFVDALVRLRDERAKP